MHACAPRQTQTSCGTLTLWTMQRGFKVAQQSQCSSSACAGLAVFALGFGIEVVADWQKASFKSNPENKGRFINEGLWSVSRHPNYFGEMMLVRGQCAASVRASVLGLVCCICAWTCVLHLCFICMHKVQTSHKKRCLRLPCCLCSGGACSSLAPPPLTRAGIGPL